MTRRAPPGPQLGAGRLRVDAARAIAKLREYRLAVRAAWVLEAIRAAVASGATRISLTGDTNDLWLAWDGEPWPAADLPRLFDELVGPEASDERYHVRLLAAAVNSALGMAPVHVDVFAVAKEGRAVRARYTPDVLDEPAGELGDAPLRRIGIEPAAPPPGAGPGMAIHLRRRFGMAVLAHLVRELPEIELARAACADLDVPLVVRGALQGRDSGGARDVVRVPLGDGLRGFLAITDPDGAATHPVLEVAEHGVVLAVSPADLGFPELGRPVPVRVRVDGPRMPTNASRSEVRQDLHPIATALRRARALLPAAADALAAALAGAALVGAALAGAERPERARAAALALLAATRGGATARLGLGRLLELPLARNAVGAPRPLSAGWSGLVHAGATPFPEELAPWLGDVLWVPPGDPAAHLVELEVDTQAVKRLARWARRERRAQRRFYEHAPRRPVVEARERPRLRARLGAAMRGSCVDPAGFAGLTGEVCIRSGGEKGEVDGELVLLLEGRELERITYRSAIPFTAVIDSPGLAPADRYRSAARDEEHARVEVAMRAGVLCAIEAIAASLGGGAGDGDSGDSDLGDGEHADARRNDGDDDGDGDDDRDDDGNGDRDGRGSSDRVDARRGVGDSDGSDGGDGGGDRTDARRGDGGGDRTNTRRDGGDAGRGFVHGEPAPEADRRLVLAGLSLALELAQGSAASDARLAGPLLEAPLWRRAGRAGWASTAELRRCAVVGVTAAGARLRALPRRPIVEVDARDEALLAALLPPTTRIVPYDAALVEPEPLYSIDLAQGLLAEGDLALAVRPEPGGPACAAAIAPSAAPRVVISHMGRRVEERPYTPALVPCAIHVDSDDVIPDGAWRAALADGGVTAHFAAWELALLRAGAAALVGERVPDLLDQGPVEPEGVLGRALWTALADGEPARLLGDALATKLRARPLFRVLGERAPLSAADLAARHPDRIPYLYALQDLTAAEPIEGFAPLLADQVLARAAGQLAGRGGHDAGPELAEHSRAAARAGKLAALRAQPALPLELPGGGITVRRESIVMRAVVGVGRGSALEVELRAEGRRVAAIVRPGEPPVAAVVEVAVNRLDNALAAPRALEDAIVLAVRAAIPELLAAIAGAEPAALADLGPARTLLAATLAVLYLSQDIRAAIAAAPAFPTLGGERTSLARAARGGVVATASWEGEWLGPDNGEAGSELDRPILFVPANDGELLGVIERLHRHAVVDLTEAVGKLQAQRRIARGLLQPPRVHGALPELKRRLAELGPAAAALGPGEIGLVDEAGSTVLIHVQGVLREGVALDVLPPVRLAIEAPELVGASGAAVATLRPAAQGAARALLRAVRGQLPVLPVWLRHRLRRTLLDGVAIAELEGAPLFEAIDGAWLDRAAIARQVELFGDLWCLAGPVPDAVPLDPRRVVLRLAEDEQQLARRADLRAVDAAGELALDAQARANLARRRPDALAIDPAFPALATVRLAGDGRAAPRGVVAVLAPGAAHHRGTYAHRELFPFEVALDECPWPTRAVVDDAGLAPDRTWSRAVPDARWKALLAAIREASEAALRDLVHPPPRALASQLVGAAEHVSLTARRGDTATQLRGALWIDSAPDAPGRIEVIHEGGTEPHTPPPGVALAGTLYVLARLREPWIRNALDELCRDTYARLLAQVAARAEPGDLAAAHVARGIARDIVEPTADWSIRFACFRPRPIDAYEWRALCRNLQRLPLVDPDATPDELAVTDDGSATARVVLDVLGERAYRDLPALSPPPPERIAAPPLREAPARPAHPLDPLAAAVAARLRRLGLAPPTIAVLPPVTTPIACYVDEAIGLAGAHPRLRAIAAGLAAGAPWSAAAVDALTAHVATVLNVALTSVTDATEAHVLGGLLRGG
jgi:hypothetical protein